YCYYDDIKGLQVSSNVQVRGMNVGRVSNIELADNKGVKVTITVDDNIKVTQGTVAMLASADLVTGTKLIKLNLGNSAQQMDRGSVLQTDIEKSFLDNIGEDISPVVKTAKVVMAELDSVVANVHDILNEKNKLALSHSMQSIESITNNI